jgi:DNA-binding IclR family transcriptional regulator
VGYRVGARHPLDRGAAGKAILLGRALAAGDRRGRPEFVATHGELQPGAFGVAAPVLGSSGIEASVGVVALQALDAAHIGPRVTAAAREIARKFG